MMAMTSTYVAERHDGSAVHSCVLVSNVQTSDDGHAPCLHDEHVGRALT